MKKITLLLIFLAVSFGYSQQVLIEDFESSPALDSWDGTAVVVGADPVSSNGANMQVDVTAGNGQFWQGAKVTLPSDVNMDLTTDITVVVDIYATTAMTIMGKVESNSGAPAAADDENHGGTGWETITFTFNTGADGTATANGNYNVFAVFPNRDGSGGWTNPWASSTTYFDNLTAVLAAEDLCTNGVQDPGEEGIDCGGTCPNACPSPPTVAAPTPPARPAADVISLYSDAYSDVTSNFDAGWCGGGSISEVMIGGNATQQYLDNPCQGIVLDAGVDASTFTNLHVDVYIQADTDLTSSVFNLKYVQQPGGAALEINLNVASSPALVAGSWMQIDIPVDLTTFTGFKEFGITSNINGKVWYDNLYTHKDTVLSTDDFEASELSVYPNPTNNVWNVKTNNQVINSVQVFDILGKQVISFTPRMSEVSIDATGLNNGIYLAKITSDNGSKTIKLIKE